MIWSDLKKLKIEDIVLYINEQLEVKSMRKIAEDLGLKDDSTIRKYITGKGYKRVNSSYIAISGKNDDRCNHQEHTPNKSDITSENTSVINLPDMKDNMIYISNEIETLKDMINWFKSKDDKSNTNVIEIVQGIKIDLPEANIKRTTIRINEKIWEDFNRFVEDNKPIDKHDLMGMALKEYMENHSNKMI